jgi:hypothetical protein
MYQNRLFPRDDGISQTCPGMCVVGGKTEICTACRIRMRKSRFSKLQQRLPSVWFDAFELGLSFVECLASVVQHNMDAEYRVFA